MLWIIRRKALGSWSDSNECQGDLHITRLPLCLAYCKKKKKKILLNLTVFAWKGYTNDLPCLGHRTEDTGMAKL